MAIENETENWAAREFFCPHSSRKNNPCGDPVVGANQQIYFTHRRLNFIGFETKGWTMVKTAVYECPVCKHQHTVPIKSILF